MWIKAFQAAGDFFLYSAWNNTIHRVSRRLFDHFANGSQTVTNAELQSDAVALKLLPETPVALEIFPDSMVRDVLARLQREGPVLLVLTLTEACNYRCRYCVFSGAYPHARQHGNRTMPEETAIRALEWYFAFHRTHYRVTCYGGEPLLEYKVIERVVAKARELAPPDARITFGMATNGCLLNDTSMAFLAAHEFELFISLDGPARVHDRYRRTLQGRPTFARVWRNIKRLQRLHPDYFATRVNFCVMLAPPSRIEEVSDFFEQNRDVFGDKVPVVLTLNHAPPSLYEALGVADSGSPTDVTPLRERYLAQLALGETLDGLGRAVSDAAMAALARRSMTAPPTLALTGGQCLPGTRCHVTPGGLLQACERCDPELLIGSVDAGFDESKIKALLRSYGRLFQSRCSDCWAVRLCRKCIVDVAEGPVLSANRLAEICDRRRRQIERNLIDFCRARSQNDHCFDHLTLDRGDLIH